MSLPKTSGMASLRAIKWTSVTLPGDVCPHQTATVTLSHGMATIPPPPGVNPATGLTVSDGSPVFGDLYGPGKDVAAVNVWCSRAHGSAASELENSWVVYTDSGGTPDPVATLLPQQPAADRHGVHVPDFDSSPGGISIVPGRITVKELWYAPEDATCCPSEHVTTVWHAHGDSFSAVTSVG